MAQIIPLDNSPNQTLDVQLNVNGANKNLRLFIRFNEAASYRTMAIIDPETGSYLVDAIPLLCGDYPAADLLKPYQYLRIGSAYLLNMGSTADHPDATNMKDFNLIWGDNAA